MPSLAFNKSRKKHGDNVKCHANTHPLLKELSLNLAENLEKVGSGILSNHCKYDERGC